MAVGCVARLCCCQSSLTADSEPTRLTHDARGRKGGGRVAYRELLTYVDQAYYTIYVQFNPVRIYLGR